MFIPFFCFGSHIIFFRFFIDHDLFSFVSLFVILYQIFFQLFLGSVILILNEFLLTQMICSVFGCVVWMVGPLIGGIIVGLEVCSVSRDTIYWLFVCFIAFFLAFILIYIWSLIYNLLDDSVKLIHQHGIWPIPSIKLFLHPKNTSILRLPNLNLRFYHNYSKHNVHNRIGFTGHM